MWTPLGSKLHHSSPSMKNHLRYALLRAMKFATRRFYRYQLLWLHEEPPDPWREIRLLALLNHTSLYEWLFVGLGPNPLLKRIAYHALIPAADVTMNRAGIGPFLKALAPEVVPITRQPDHTWDAVIAGVKKEKMVLILPEGRMKRANGLDKHGKRMTVRGGIADLLRTIGSGKMLLAYSGGVHHVQAPGEGLPRLFKELRIALELIDIREYRQALGESEEHRTVFKRRVIADLERRRDHYCPQLAPDRSTDHLDILPETGGVPVLVEPS